MAARTGAGHRWSRVAAAAVLALALAACGEAAPTGPVAGDDGPSAPPAAGAPSEGSTAGDGSSAGASDPTTAGAQLGANGLVGADLDGVAAGPEGALAVVGAADGGAAAWSSADDDGWRRADVEDADDVERLRAVSSGAGGFIAFGGADDEPSTGWSSDDGTVWTPMDVAGVDVRVNAVSADGEGWIAVGDLIAPEGGGSAAGVVLQSSDGVTWEVATDRLRAGDGTVSDVAVGDGDVVAVGFDTARGRIWRDPVSQPRPVDGDFTGTTIQGVAATDDGFVALGRAVGDLHAVVWTSPDGRTWERQDLDTEAFAPTDEINDLAAADAGVVAAGTSPDGGVLWTSSDGGATWERRAP